MYIYTYIDIDIDIDIFTGMYDLEINTKDLNSDLTINGNEQRIHTCHNWKSVLTKRQLTWTVYATPLMTFTTDLGLSIRVAMFEYVRLATYLFPSPLQWARAETGELTEGCNSEGVSKGLPEMRGLPWHEGNPCIFRVPTISFQ